MTRQAMMVLVAAVASCDGGPATGDDGSPSGRADARAAAPQAFDCSGRYTRKVVYSATSTVETTTHFASIGKLNPAEAPEVDAWICDYSCREGSCGCPMGATCEDTGDVFDLGDGVCQSTTVMVRPNGDAIVVCGSETTQVAGDVTYRYGSFAARAYLRL